MKQKTKDDIKQVLKALARLALEVFIRTTPGRTLRWRLGMRLNHLNWACKRWPRCYAWVVNYLRSAICGVFEHRWSDWELVKYGNFGRSRGCKVCQLRQTEDENGVSRFYDTHTPGGWVEVKDDDV